MRFPTNSKAMMQQHFRRTTNSLRCQVLAGVSPASRGWCSSSSSFSTTSSRQLRLSSTRPTNTARLFSSTTTEHNEDDRSRSEYVLKCGDPKVAITVHVPRKFNKPGTLRRVAEHFETNLVNMTHIESKPHYFAHDGLTFQIDFDGSEEDSNVKATLEALRKMGAQVEVSHLRRVPWFPTSVAEVDYCVIETIEGGESGGLINPDHPGFNDPEYIKRRSEIAEIGNSYKYGAPIPEVQYTDDELKVWNAVFTKLQDYHQRWACDEYLRVFPALAREAGYGPHQIPQIGDISTYLKGQTGFQLRPVNGLLSARDFLNALAFRVFCSTQYIRHGGNPFYTPEPDVCHELIGHVPLLADPDFADFTQEVGLASLGASDETIVKLASIYWFTVEFGLVKSAHADETGHRPVKVMGAGILSSFGEMEWSACSGNPSEESRIMGGIARDYPDLKKPKILPFRPSQAAVLPYPITTYQPTYFCGESIEVMKAQISNWTSKQKGDFNPVYDAITQRVKSSRAVSRKERTSTAHLQSEKQAEYFAALEEEKKMRKEAA